MHTTYNVSTKPFFLKAVRQGRFILSLWGPEDRERRLFIDTAVDCYWMLACTKVSEKQSQNRRAFALFTIVVLNGQKITDRSCHVLPLFLAHKGTRRQFESWTKETRNQNSSQRISHSNTPLESLTTLATLFILLLCSIVWSELEFDSSTFPTSTGMFWHCTIVLCVINVS